ncbi:MAG: FGGY-family carbohydrate kinase [Synechococcaceae cyanobacterium]
MLRLALGLDLGSSGLRLAVLSPDGPAGGVVLDEDSSPYPGPFEDPQAWLNGLIQLLSRLQPSIRQRLGAIAIDGTSGTLLICRSDGSLPSGTLGRALAYHQACEEHAELVLRLAGSGPAASPSGSLARALRLLARAALEHRGGGWLLRHQADWLMGWVLGDWRWGEEGNNLRLGWDPQNQQWSGVIDQQAWSQALPRICPSGKLLGVLAPEAATLLNLPADCRVVAGSTDANAAVLAADPGPGDGITVLGTTLVLKRFLPHPLEGPGLSNHRLDGRWLVGGASNSGAGVLRQFFSDRQLAELSRQINPDRPSGLQLRPLPRRGERFPVDNPELEPILGPRPCSDALFLQGLLEGLSDIEAHGWQRLQPRDAPPLRRVITLGGGAVNPQWRALRQRRLGLPVLNRPHCSAALGMARLAARRMGD